MADTKSISELVAPIAQKYGADRVALFGSRAKNTATETSDYDFVISKGKIQSLRAGNDIWGESRCDYRHVK